MKSADAVMDAMAALGETPDAVADSLRKMGVRGYRGSCFACPVARYLSGLCSGFVTVGDIAVVYDAVGPDRYAPPSPRRLPAAVLEFVNRFDDGLYPDLREGDMEGESE